jgi:hypothetical protein
MPASDAKCTPVTPSIMKRSCQRQTAVLLVPLPRMIAAVPQPSAVSRMIRPPDMFLWTVPIRQNGFKFGAVLGNASDYDTGEHAEKLARWRRNGNVIRHGERALTQTRCSKCMFS